MSSERHEVFPKTERFIEATQDRARANYKIRRERLEVDQNVPDELPDDVGC